MILASGTVRQVGMMCWRIRDWYWCRVLGLRSARDSSHASAYSPKVIVLVPGHVPARRRYEAGEQQPLLSVAVAIADALGISVAELAGKPSHRIRLSGQWWSSWQTSRSGAEKIASQQVEIKQEGDILQVATVTRGLSEDEGGYHWNGELRLSDNEILMGWYAANDGSIRSKATMYFRCTRTGCTCPAAGSDWATTGGS